MSTLAHVFEAEGLATVTLGSIQKQIEGVAPPRGLYCDFPLGRPLGKPRDPEFQHAVLEYAFGLLDAKAPILETFPEMIEDDGVSGLACPLPPRSNDKLHPAIDELRGLRSAYERAVEQYGNHAGPGRTVSADGLEQAIEALRGNAVRALSNYLMLQSLGKDDNLSKVAHTFKDKEQQQAKEIIEEELNNDAEVHTVSK